MSDDVLVERRGPVLVIVINRPKARNAIDASVARAVAAAADELDGDNDLRVGVLTGADGTFSAGMDLKAFLRGESPAIPGRGLCGITEQPPRKPLIAAVAGWALAGGFELALACDLIVADETAVFGLPEVQRGLVPAGGGALLLARRTAPALALEVLLTGSSFDARRAAELGLVNHVVEPGRALDAAIALASRIAENAPLAVAAAKQIARSNDSWTGQQGWRTQEDVVDSVLTSADAREGAAAFAEKRAPHWQGR